MSLTDIMSHSDLSTYPQVALAIFLLVFASITGRILLSGKRREEYLKAAMLPFEDHSDAPLHSHEEHLS